MEFQETRENHHNLENIYAFKYSQSLSILVGFCSIFGGEETRWKIEDGNIVPFILYGVIIYDLTETFQH